VRLWDVARGEEIRRFNEHRDAVTGVAFGPDGRTAVSGSWDTTVLVWQTVTVDELARWTLANRYVRELSCGERQQYRVEPYCD
jgi:WD40 repeat protein